MNQTEEYSSGDFDENTPIHLHNTKGSRGKVAERAIKEVVVARSELSVSPGSISNQVGGGTSPIQAVITTLSNRVRAANHQHSPSFMSTTSTTAYNPFKNVLSGPQGTHSKVAVS